MTITATEVKNHFGQYLEASITNPVFIHKTGRPVAVMLSTTEYERLINLEDAFWAQKALNGERSGYIGKQASTEFLNSK